MSVPQELTACITSLFPKEVSDVLRNFLQSYFKAAGQSGYTQDSVMPRLRQFFDFVKENMTHPYSFNPFHKSIREPFDYYAFGLEFIRPLIDFTHSQVLGKEALLQISQALARSENVILFANHQTEVEPQIISLLLEKSFPNLALDMIFVAGHRVYTDPMAIPFSMGRNLFCIYSKKYIDNPLELKVEKIQHNQRTLKTMEELLREGGKCIYIAPSGGRDRMNEQGVVEVAPFDPDSIELMYLMARRSKRKTHFHTLALSTYRVLPPPKEMHRAIGELRDCAFCPVYLFFGQEIDMEVNLQIEKFEQRRQRALRFFEEVVNNYGLLCKMMTSKSIEKK